jgi:hypothetical protein
MKGDFFMTDLNKVSPATKKTLDEIRQMGGNKTKTDTPEEFEALKYFLSGKGGHKVTGSDREFLEGEARDYETRELVSDDTKARVIDIVKNGKADDNNEIQQLKNLKKTKGLSDDDKKYIQRVIDGMEAVEVDKTETPEPTKKDGATKVDKVELPEPQETPDKDNVYSIKEDKEDVYENIPTIDGSNTTWEDIAKQYPCLEIALDSIEPKSNASGKAVRALKIAQAITNGDYSLETISKLVEMSYLHPEEMKNVEGLDYNVYKNTLQANVLGQNVKVPKELAGCQRNESISLVARNVRRTSRVINQNGSAADRACVGSNCTYYAKFNGVEHNYGSDMAARDKAVAEFRAKHPNARVEKDQK